MDRKLQLMKRAATSSLNSQFPDQQAITNKTYSHKIEGDVVQTASLGGAIFDFQSIVEETTMLILARRRNETIQISDDIKVTVLEVKGNQVRLGIEAPGDVKILREELLAQEE